jgi:uncharacterized sulfatase
MSKRQAILIMTDTQGVRLLGCYGNPDMKTPCLDRLASQGVRFDRAYTCQPVCGPARSALFTGLAPHSNGSWANCMPLGDTVLTLGQRLRDEGILTAYIGKWHLDGGDYFGMGRCPDGWDPATWYDMRNYLEELSDADRLRSRKPGTNREGIEPGFTFGRRCADRALAFLERHADEDFLLVLSFDEPHDPFLCPEPYASMYQDYRMPKSPAYFADLAGKPAHQRVWAGGRDQRPRTEREAEPNAQPDYLGCNSFVDSEIGRVVDGIDRTAPGALVACTSDHGDMLGAFGLWGKGPAAYDAITRIPLLVRWPGRAPAGAVCPHPVSHIDLTPTLLEYFGAPRPPLLEGLSLLPCFAEPGRRLNEAVFIEFGRYETDHDGFGGFQPLRCVCDGRHKLTINLLTSDELYDLEQDPHELRNLIGSPAHAALRDGLHDRLIDWMNRTRDPFRGSYWLNRPWRGDAPEPTWDFTRMTRQREELERYEKRQLDYGTGLAMRAATRTKGTS